MADQDTGPFAWVLQSALSSAVVLASFTWENDSSHRKLISHQEILKINAKKRLILIFYTTSVSGYLLQNIVLLSSRLKTGWCSKQSPALVLYGPLLTANIYKHFHFLYDIPPHKVRSFQRKRPLRHWWQILSATLRWWLTRPQKLGLCVSGSVSGTTAIQGRQLKDAL